MKNTVYVRLAEIIDRDSDGNVQAFAKSIGIPPTTLRSAMQRQSNLSINVLQQLKEKYPEMDMNIFFNDEEGVGIVSEKQANYETKETIYNTEDPIDRLISFLKTNTLKVNIESGR